VSLRIASVVPHLPSTDDNNAPFAGVMPGNHLPRRTIPPTQEHALKVKQTTEQMQDAEKRNFTWNAEDELGDEDAEGEDDEEYLSSVNGTCNNLTTTRVGHASGVASVEIGIRDEQGVASNEVIIAGVTEGVPHRVRDLVCVVVSLS
jgi:hypothetical protein